MKKILVSLLSVFLLLGVAVGLASCNSGCEHSFGDEYVVQEATCTEAALIGYKCSKCGVEDDLNEPFINGKPLGHDYKDYTIAEYPIFGKGKLQSTCSRCPSIDNMELPAISNGSYTTEKIDENTVKYTLTLNDDTEISFDCPTTFTYEPILEDDEIIGVCAVGCKSGTKNAIIPSEYMGWRVLSVGKSSKSSSSGFLTCESIVLPEGLTGISEYAFDNCTNLKEITLPTTLKTVATGAFYECRNLVKTNVSDFVAYCSVQFENSAASPFYYASVYAATPTYLYLDGVAVTDIVIPDGVVTIGDFAFYRYDSMTSLTFSDTVKVIGVSSFESTTLTQINIPASVETIGSRAFSKTEYLTAITLNNGLIEIGESAFELSAITTIKIPDSVTNIGKYAFRRSKLTEIVIPGGVKTVSEGLFSECAQLQSVTLSDGVETVSKNAFEKCNEMDIFKVGNTLKTVEDQAFGFVAEFFLKELHISDLSSWCKVDIIGHIPTYHSVTSIYLGGQPLTDVEIPQDITEIKDRTFRGWNNLDTLIIPSYITSIGELAFYGSSLKEIILPVGIAEIKNAAFFSCEFLENVYYEGSMEDWDNLEKASDDISSDKLCYYSEALPKDVLNKYWKYNTQNEPVLWTYEGTLNGKTYSYSNTETTVSEEYWALLKQMEQQGMLEYMFSSDTEQIAMITSSASKEEYAEKLEKYSASIFSDLKVSFANGKVTGTESDVILFSMDYIEYDGVVYYVISGNIQHDAPAFYIDEETNTVYEYTENEIAVGDVSYASTTVKHIYNLVVE